MNNGGFNFVFIILTFFTNIYFCFFGIFTEIRLDLVWPGDQGDSWSLSHILDFKDSLSLFFSNQLFYKVLASLSPTNTDKAVSHAGYKIPIRWVTIGFAWVTNVFLICPMSYQWLWKHVRPIKMITVTKTSRPGLSSFYVSNFTNHNLINCVIVTNQN